MHHCASCHGADARGTAKAPGLAMNPRVAEQSAEQLRAFLQHGNIAAGMPSFADLPRERSNGASLNTCAFSIWERLRGP